MAIEEQRRRNKIKVHEKISRRSIIFPSGHKLEYNLEKINREFETSEGRESFRKMLKRCLTKEKFVEILGEIGIHWAALELWKGQKP